MTLIGYLTLLNHVLGHGLFLDIHHGYHIYHDNTIFGQEQWLHLNFLDKYHGNIILLFDDIAKQIPWYIDKID